MDIRIQAQHKTGTLFVPVFVPVFQPATQYRHTKYMAGSHPNNISVPVFVPVIKFWYLLFCVPDFFVCLFFLPVFSYIIIKIQIFYSCICIAIPSIAYSTNNYSLLYIHIYSTYMYHTVYCRTTNSK